MTRTKHPCVGRSRRQREVFEAIAINQDEGHPSSTIEALQRAGLIKIVSFRTVGRDRFGAIRIPVFGVPLPVHAQWCQWCAENVKDEL